VILITVVHVAKFVLPDSASTANAPLKPATDQHAVASTAVLRTAFASRMPIAMASAVLISPVLLWLTAPLIPTASKERSALLALVVDVMFAWDHARVIREDGFWIAVTLAKPTRVDVLLHKRGIEWTMSYLIVIHFDSLLASSTLSFLHFRGTRPRLSI